MESFCTKCVRGLTEINSTFFVSSEINSPYFFITLNSLVPSLLSTLNPPLSPTRRKPYAGFYFLLWAISSFLERSSCRGLQGFFSLAGLNSTEWHPIKEGSTVYYHGTATSCTSLGPTSGSESDVLSGITLSTDVQGGANYTVTFTGYAIQSANIDEADSTPEQIFNMIGRNPK